MTRRKKIALTLFTIVLGVATLTFAALPATNVDPSTVPLGTLAGRTPVNVLSVEQHFQSSGHDTGDKGRRNKPFSREEKSDGRTSVIGNLTSCAAADTADDDMALVHACKNGDVTAFEQLVKRYDKRLLNIAQHVTHNLEDAQDAVQEAFLKVFRKLTQFQENSRFSTWLIRITVNESLMKLRKQRSSREVSIDEDFQSEEDMAQFELADWAPNPEELYMGSELRDILRRALQDLQPGLRVVFVLRDIEGFSTEQTAEVLELTHVAVKARLWRARLQLRKRLSKYFAVEVTYS